MITLFDRIFINVNLKKTAIIYENERITYQKLYNDSLKLCSYFKKNYGSRKKISICHQNSYYSILVFLAASKLNYILFPLNYNISQNNLINYTNKFKFDISVIENTILKKSIKKNCNFSSIISTADLKKIISKKKIINDKFLNQKNEYINNNPYLIILSSGTTGNPKPIVLSQKNKFLRSFYAGKIYKLSKSEIVILTYQLDHSVGQRLMFTSLIHNGTLVIAKNFNPSLWYNLCLDFKVTYSILVSFHIKKILKDKYNLEKLKYLKNLISVSDVLEDNVRKRILNFHFNFHEIYGAAEISTVANIKHRKNSKSKSVGKVLPFTKVKIIDNNNKFVANKMIGEIVCKTPLEFDGYYKKKLLTKKTYFKNYFKTGDLGYLDKNYLFFTGRKKNIIKISGINVYPEDIEKKLKKLSFIKDCYIKGIYDENSGQKIIAYIIGPEKKNHEIYDFCLKNLEIFQIPRRFIYVKKFRKTSLGKLHRD